MSSVNSLLERCLKLRKLYLRFFVVNSEESTEVMNTYSIIVLKCKCHHGNIIKIPHYRK